MSRHALTWILAATAVVVVAVAVGCGGDDDGETVTAADWAQNVCAAVGIWRDQMDAIAADIGPTPEAGAVRSGLDRALVETERVVDAIESSGVPDTENGEESAEQVTSWANGAVNDLNQAQSALDDDPSVADAAGTIEGVVESGRQVLADIVATDPGLGDAIRDSGTCQQIQIVP